MRVFPTHAKSAGSHSAWDTLGLCAPQQLPLGILGESSRGSFGSAFMPSLSETFNFDLLQQTSLACKQLCLVFRLFSAGV